MLTLPFKGANKNIVHVATTVCEKEYFEEYKYLVQNVIKFREHLQSVLNNEPRTCFTDRHKRSDAAAFPAVWPLAHIHIFHAHTCYFVTFTSRRLQQHEKLALRQGHPCLWFFHDFATPVIPKFCSFCDTHKCKFLNSLIHICFRDIHKWTLATNVKNQLVGKIIRACDSFMTL